MFEVLGTSGYPSDFQDPERLRSSQTSRLFVPGPQLSSGFAHQTQLLQAWSRKVYHKS
jgi:hypothetical protein